MDARSQVNGMDGNSGLDDGAANFDFRLVDAGGDLELQELCERTRMAGILELRGACCAFVYASNFLSCVHRDDGDGTFFRNKFQTTETAMNVHGSSYRLGENLNFP